MKRRRFLGSALFASLGWMARPGSAVAFQDTEDDEGSIDPYYLESGDLPAQEQETIATFMKYQDDVLDGRPAVMPRGGKPERAPTYRFLHWPGRLGDPNGRLVGALTLSPTLSGPGPFSVNGQILGFNVSTEDWKNGKGTGTLMIELRARYQNEPMTWLYMEQFEAIRGGSTSIGLEYVAQRDGVPEPVICEDPRVDLRIQLIRQKKEGGIFKKVLKAASFLSGLSLPGGGSPGSGSLAGSRPVMRVPQMLHEGVAFAQGTVAGMAKEAPVWRGGFTSLALTRDAGRIALRPGLWVAVDDSQMIDYSKIQMADIGGKVGLLQDGLPVDLNYLVLALEIEPVAHKRGEVIPKG